MITIKEFKPEIEISANGSDSGSILLLESSQRVLIAWFKEHKPELLRDIICEECPENNARVASHNYFYCAREHGEKHT